MDYQEMSELDMILLTAWCRYRLDFFGVNCESRRGQEALAYLALCCHRGPGSARRCLRACAEAAGMWWLAYNSLLNAALRPVAYGDPEALAYFGLEMDSRNAIGIGEAFAAANAGIVPRKLEAQGSVYN